MIDVWGADHGGYVKRMRAAVTAITDGESHLEVRICQLVRLFRAGEPVKMSKRAGQFVTLREVVEEVGDLWALERAGVVSGRFHVLGGHLSPLDGIGPDDLRIGGLLERARHADVVEVLLALNATVEGQSTAHYVTEQLESADVKVSRLAHGVPVGGELDYLDEGTLAAAVKSRKEM